jgi:hypothetical protein
MAFLEKPHEAEAEAAAGNADPSRPILFGRLAEECLDVLEGADGPRHGNPLHKTSICGRLAEECLDVPRREVRLARLSAKLIAFLELVLGG